MALYNVYISRENGEEIHETATTINKAKSIAKKYQKDTYVVDMCITDNNGSVAVHYDRLDSGYGKPEWFAF